jgi:esterase/lipase superfamily enzyme
MHREYHKWFSPALGREMELLVFGRKGRRMLVFPSRLNRFYEYEDHGMVHSIRHAIEAGDYQLICVDGIDAEALYDFDRPPEERVARHLAYERYVLDEVLPFSERLNPNPLLTSHGCSFGAYHALAIALRHPQHFRDVLAFSGRYDLTLHTGDFHSLFHGYYSDELREIMPSHFVPTLPAGKRLRAARKLLIKLVVGEDDPFYENNAALAAALAEKKIPHELHLWSGNAHRFRYWRQMIRIYLPKAPGRRK